MTKANRSLLLFSMLLLFACGKSNTYPDIPVVQVELTISLSLPQYSVLNGIGNNVKVAGGYKGI